VAPAPIVINEANVHGRFITKGTMPLAVEIIEKRMIPIEKLITHRLPLHETGKGIELMRSGEGVKVIIELDR
jgi:threonine dehydrogenase-like Zn-dependent dehydrogenase